MKALILGKFNSLGGTQFLIDDVGKVLENSGYSIDAVTGKNHRFASGGYGRIYETGYPYFSENNRLLLLANFRRLKHELRKINFGEYDMTFNNYPTTFLYDATINYLHGPSFVDSVVDEDGKVINRTRLLLIRLSRIYSVYRKSIFLTHGKYTRDLSLRLLPMVGIRPGSIEYIHIPINYDFDVNLGEKDPKQVLCFGRISPQKTLDPLLNIARKVDASFIISGFVDERHRGYVESLCKLAPDNLKIIPNPSEAQKVELFRRASVYVHTYKKEHYGVAVAEAIHFGCIPVVPKSGGPWVDIANYGEFGLGYTDAEEAVQKISEALATSRSERERIFSSRQRFEFSRFEESFKEFLSRISDAGIRNRI